MKKIFLLVIATCLINCNWDDDDYICCVSPILNFSIRLVDKEGNWIEGIEEKELQIFVADSNWNILEEQPEKSSYVDGDPRPPVCKSYDRENSGKLIGILIDTYVLFFSKDGERFGDYLILQIDENKSINIQLIFEKEHKWFKIEKIVCNGKEYLIHETKDIVVE